MFGQTFGHGTLRKYVIYFGTIFNNLYLNRYDAAGNLVQNMKVPLNYGPREKFLARLDGNPNLDIPRYSKYLSAKKNSLSKIITKTYSLDKINSAIELMIDGKIEGRCVIKL